MKGKNLQIGERQHRTIIGDIRISDESKRRVTVSFSSETPVERWYGKEILCHDVGCIDLQRLNEIGVALWNHDKDYVIGRIENAICNYTEKKAYCDIIFDSDEESERIYQKVKNGTLKGVSVGYTVSMWESVQNGKISKNGRFKGDCEIATQWAPYEVSIVSIPADASVGVGRELERERYSTKLLEMQVQVNKNFYKAI